MGVMELDINQKLRGGYEEAMFDLDSYKSQAVKKAINKIEKHTNAIELRLAFAQNQSEKYNIENKSLHTIMYTAKYYKHTLKKFRKDWFVKAMTLFMDGYAFDGILFTKGEEKIHFKQI